MVIHYLHTVMTVCGKIGSDFILEVLNDTKLTNAMF